MQTKYVLNLVLALSKRKVKKHFYCNESKLLPGTSWHVLRCDLFPTTFVSFCCVVQVFSFDLGLLKIVKPDVEEGEEEDNEEDAHGGALGDIEGAHWPPHHHRLHILQLQPHHPPSIVTSSAAMSSISSL